MRVSLVVVCHHSSGVLPECAEGFRRAGRDASVDTEVVVVEQSEDETERRTVADSDVERLLVRPNRGYAAGLNAGIGEATGEVLLLANPDLRFGKDSLAPLLRALDDGYDVVGPQLVWDDSGDVLFPPAEDPAPSAELGRILRARWQPAWRRGLNDALDELWRVWTATGTVTVPSLRGPLLATRRSTADRMGPFDEGYFLYYEETEWLWRARRRGARFGLGTDSRVTHHWGHSTATRADRDDIAERSRERFFARNYPVPWRWVLRRIAGRPPVAGVEPVEVTGAREVPDTDADLWLVSSLSHLQPAVGCIGRSTLPDRIAEISDTGRWYVLAAGRGSNGWRTLGSWTWCRS